MRALIGVSMALMLTGCISELSLISQDSKRYEMKVDQAKRRLSTTIDGIDYTGTAVASQSVAFGTGQTFGLKPTFGTSTTVIAGNDAKALLTSKTGEYLECAYTKSGMSIIGRCVTNTGRQFVMTTN